MEMEFALLEGPWPPFPSIAVSAETFFAIVSRKGQTPAMIAIAVISSATPPNLLLRAPTIAREAFAETSSATSMKTAQKTDCPVRSPPLLRLPRPADPTKNATMAIHAPDDTRIKSKVAST